MPDHRALVQMSSPIRTWRVLVVLLAACAPSEEEIEGEFEVFVAARNHCESTTDCVLVDLECPLGCFIAVRSEHARAAREKAQELIADYESGGRSCDYGCVQAPPLECRRERCFPGTRWFVEDGGQQARVLDRPLHDRRIAHRIASP